MRHVQELHSALYLSQLPTCLTLVTYTKNYLVTKIDQTAMKDNI